MSQIKRAVTERDFRAPEFTDADPADYEFREDGKVVRKDRWERGIRSIQAIVGSGRRNFEIPDLVAKVEAIVGFWHEADPDDFPEASVKSIDVKLSCGSFLHGLTRDPEGRPVYRWHFRQVDVGPDWFEDEVIEWRVTPEAEKLGDKVMVPVELVNSKEQPS